MERNSNSYEIKKLLKGTEDWEYIQLHLTSIELLANCARHSMYGVMQARKLVTVESLLIQIQS